MLPFQPRRMLGPLGMPQMGGPQGSPFGGMPGMNASMAMPGMNAPMGGPQSPNPTLSSWQSPIATGIPGQYLPPFPIQPGAQYQDPLGSQSWGQPFQPGPPPMGPGAMGAPPMGMPPAGPSPMGAPAPTGGASVGGASAGGQTFEDFTASSRGRGRGGFDMGGYRDALSTWVDELRSSISAYIDLRKAGEDGDNDAIRGLFSGHPDISDFMGGSKKASKASSYFGKTS